MAPENFQASYHFLCVSPRLITSATALVFWFAAYKDLQSREDTRSGAWQQEGWDEVVYYTGEAKGWWTRAGDWNSVVCRTACCDWSILKCTLGLEDTTMPHCLYVTFFSPLPVPLIQHMDSRIMIPTKASPLQWSETPRVRGCQAEPFFNNTINLEQSCPSPRPPPPSPPLFL